MAKVTEVYSIGDIVSWTSQANGSWKTKTGTITHVYYDKKGVVTQYAVSVPPKEGSKAKPKMYYPWASALHRECVATYFN
ncbi:hypothetical protein NQI61_003086 [Salmonella enterica]|uniref:Hypervirulence associated protein TUDOR domain-containing protein n=1 Tax=Salmonella enterica subsp. enterica serovar Newport str. CFSAN000835 TaxID=1299174 RepID=A0A658IF15_SALNE|nr:hypothetical protein [Salmonella enterica]EIG0184765.1 hypothetical protein [Salmonella enterica]EJN6148019.1 hypothetical protein [Salmonella enterica]ELP9742255.1 hypothetical protein [Salmonella enterica]PXV46894.1 hypothetical protein DLN05_23270 [Salmonella enterica subsp. enterica serovar Newport str. CFSAN000834]RIQ23823.1 hypothetical protein DLN06_23515 [Salmonella enterica subsp. enterica serovar Newport str. CFSAN000835]